jgi:hypothetical protein
MEAAEWLLAGLLLAGGARSLWIWSRRRFEGTDLVDHLLYAAFVTGRVGLWVAFAGLFAIYASSDVQGRAFVDEFDALRWYLVVLVGLSAVQFVSSQLLGRRLPAASGRGAAADPAANGDRRR